MNAPKELRPYHAMIWQPPSGSLGVRVMVLAESLDEAKRKLEAEHGAGTVHDLRNKDDADAARAH